ncbi:hypothetical protein M8C21_027116, partial [Ambrosia artemisiifolia]
IGCWAISWTAQFSTVAEHVEWQTMNAALGFSAVNSLEDRWKWIGDKGDTFSVKSLKRMLQTDNNIAVIRFKLKWKDVSLLNQSGTLAEDCWYWTVESKSEFSVKTVTKLIQNNAGADNSFSFKWVPIKCNVMAWRASMGRLPVKTELVKRNVQIDLVVGSHGVKAEGYEIEDDGKLIAVFSAPNYCCDQMENKGAFTRFEAPTMEPKIVTFSDVVSN